MSIISSKDSCPPLHRMECRCTPRWRRRCIPSIPMRLGRACLRSMTKCNNNEKAQHEAGWYFLWLPSRRFEMCSFVFSSLSATAFAIFLVFIFPFLFVSLALYVIRRKCTNRFLTGLVEIKYVLLGLSSIPRVPASNNQVCTSLRLEFATPS